MSEVYRLAELKDAEQLLDVTYRAYQLIRELGLHYRLPQPTWRLLKTI